ncbi:MAG: hypothetical protein Q7U75_00485, partial [Desulfobacterales bacterium]|nr:hypothetical protein [Desulfobacterales bacterium]
MTTDTDFFNPTEHQEAAIEQAGWYTVEIIALQHMKAKTGTEGWEFKLRVLIGPAAGAIITEVFWDTPTALGRLGSFTKLFYQGQGFHRSNAAEVWAVYGGARVAAEVGFETNDDGTRGRVKIRRFGKVPDKDRPALAGVSRFAPPAPPEGMLVTRLPKQKRDYGGGGGGGGYGGGGGGGDTD